MEYKNIDEQFYEWRVPADWSPVEVSNWNACRISLPCRYCCSDWDCAARPSCPKSDERYQSFLNAGSDPRSHLKKDGE